MGRDRCRYRHSFYRTLGGRVICQFCGEVEAARPLPPLPTAAAATPHAYLRHDAHDTEAEAADAAYQSSAATRARVYRFILDRDEFGATDQETEAGLGMRAQTVTPRRLELVEEGLVVKTAQRRLTPRGRSAIVWVAKAVIDRV